MKALAVLLEVYREKPTKEETKRGDKEKIKQQQPRLLR